ncbi:MAG: hypothetical protein ACE5JN_12660 [Candidatus Methylomirabilia bacterium]
MRTFRRVRYAKGSAMLDRPPQRPGRDLRDTVAFVFGAGILWLLVLLLG